MEVVPGANNDGNEETVNKNGLCSPDEGYSVQDNGKISDEIKTPEQPKESRAEMLSRHQRESRELQNMEVAMKKEAAKGSKAEQKAKKKQVEDDIAKLDAKMKARHAKELSSLGYTSKDSNDLDNLVKAVAGVSVTSTGHTRKPNKSAKRREKIAQQEAEREQRIQEEQEEQGNIISDRVLENERLQQKLQPLGLSLYEIKADGHCLYRAVENQLSLYPLQCQYSYQQLREMAADYMRSHAEDFLPFFPSNSENDTELNDNLQERFEKHCVEVESTTAWGGQLELGALSHSLRKHMVIFAGSFPDVEMGKEYKSENPSIMLSYHKHAFALGEHYNSVVPIQGTASS